MNVPANCDRTHKKSARCKGRLADDVEFCLLFHCAVYRAQAEACTFGKQYNFASQCLRETVSPLGEKDPNFCAVEEN